MMVKKDKRWEMEGMAFIVAALVYLRGSEVVIEVVDGWMVTGATFSWVEQFRPTDFYPLLSTVYKTVLIVPYWRMIY